MSHHHHASVTEVVVFHDENEEEPFYIFKDWNQTDKEPCSCELTDPREVSS